MSDYPELWRAADRYFENLFEPPDARLWAILEQSRGAGLPDIQVTPMQGAFLELVARIHGARRILEVGTLGGYSTAWLARTLPADGRLVTLELEEKHAVVARENLAPLEFADRIEIRVGDAEDSLRELVSEGVEPFDLVFLDADKRRLASNFDWSLKLVRPGALIIADNVVRDGAVADADSGDERVRGVRDFFSTVSSDQRLRATALQTVGAKGYDGFALIHVAE